MKTRIDFPADDGARLALRFSQPDRMLFAHSLSEVERVVAEAQYLAKAGFWITGFVSYEAAPAFDRALKVSGRKQALPLAMFAAYDGVSVSAADALDQGGLRQSWRGTPWRMDETLPVVETAINKIRTAIGDGEYYQINYTGRLVSTGVCEGADFFEDLRLTQPNGYCAHFEHQDWQVMSVSPELFFDWRADRETPTLTTRPMKGTAPRHASPQQDLAAERALRDSAKDRAENVMIVDLLRNDMARVAASGTVSVPRLFAVEGLPTAWQMTSTVQCVTRPEVTLVEVFRALFPCGSVTGAPKVAAMTAIATLETMPRGAYCGAIGLIRPGGHATFNVGIRTVTLDTATGTAVCGLGSGITWESSVPEEYAEWLVKRRFLLRASAGFELYETMRLEDGVFVLLDRHLFRLTQSAEHFGFSMDVQATMGQLDLIQANHATGAWRVRLLLNCGGALRTECAAIESAAIDGNFRVALALTAINSLDERLHHKTTQREIYDDHASLADCYDTLLWNERGELTEFTRGNVVAELDGRRVTPPLRCGLLSGTLRAEMLALDQIEEAIVRIVDLPRVSQIWFINSVRGMLPVQLLAVEQREGSEHVG